MPRKTQTNSHAPTTTVNNDATALGPLLVKIEAIAEQAESLRMFIVADDEYRRGNTPTDFSFSKNQNAILLAVAKTITAFCEISASLQSPPAGAEEVCGELQKLANVVSGLDATWQSGDYSPRLFLPPLDEAQSKLYAALGRAKRYTLASFAVPTAPATRETLEQYHDERIPVVITSQRSIDEAKQAAMEARLVSAIMEALPQTEPPADATPDEITEARWRAITFITGTVASQVERIVGILLDKKLKTADAKLRQLEPFLGKSLDEATLQQIADLVGVKTKQAIEQTQWHKDRKAVADIGEESDGAERCHSAKKKAKTVTFKNKDNEGDFAGRETRIRTVKAKSN